MADFTLKEDYRLAACCSPSPPDDIIGYYSHDNVIKLHRKDCPQVADVEPQRLISANWDEVLDNSPEFKPDADYGELDEIDFAVLKHHEKYGIDYSLVVARKVGVGKQEAFDRHAKLKELGLIERVEPRMVQYRKGIAKNKWIKHRNHTYYDLTDKGRRYLAYPAQNK